MCVIPGPYLVVGLLSDGRERCWGEEDYPIRDWFSALESLLRFDHAAVSDIQIRDPRAWGGWVPGTARIVSAVDWLGV